MTEKKKTIEKFVKEGFKILPDGTEFQKIRPDGELLAGSQNAEHL